MSKVSKTKRVFSAQEKAAEEGIENKAEERIEKELRAEFAQEHGAALVYRTNLKGEPVGVPKVTAPFFAAIYGHRENVLWEQDEGRFYKYAPPRGLWQVKANEEIFTDISRFTLEESRRDGMQDLEGRRGIKLDKEITEYAKGIYGKRGIFKKAPDAKERIIHLKNGVVLIRNGKIEGFRPEFSKDHFSRNQIAIDYDETATCPRTIEELLRPALPVETAEEDIDLFFQFLGVMLLGVNLPQRLLILEGAANSGKSTIMKLFTSIVGRENSTQLRTAHLGERFEHMAYLGCTLLIAPDVSTKFLLERGAEQLKSLIGGDYLTAEAKQGNERPDFDGIFNIIITTNGELRVRISNDIDAWRRRLAIIKFIEHIPKVRIPNFERILIDEEGAGIVNRALAGLQTVLDNEGKITLGKVQAARVEEILEQSEAIADFIKTRIVKREGCQLPKKRIRDEFANFCRSKRWPVPSDRETGGRIKELMQSILSVPEVNNVTVYDDQGQERQGQGYRGVDWSVD